VILITGGMGFIGLHTARRILDAGEQVVLTQFRARREPDFIQPELGKRAIAEVLDVRDGAAMLELIRKYDVTGIVHLAVPALAGVDPTEEYQVNMDGLINVLDAARQAGVKRVTIASSITVYFSLPAGPFHEEDRLPVTSANSTEAYKKAWEILALLYGEQTGLEVVMARASFIYGPLYHSMTNPPSRMAHAAVKGVPANLTNARGIAPFSGDEVDFCYVLDCASALQQLQMAPELPHRVYNVGGGRASTLAELADATRKVVPEAEIPLQEGRSPTARRDPFLDISRARQDVGYEPEYDVTRGMADYIEWLRSHPE
jgi:UDP-glucose 4-epimerase